MIPGSRLLLATRNPGKVREIRALASDDDWSWEGLDQFPDLPDPDESGSTFAENARIKALYFAQRTGLPALADDSGLCVDALGGAPGIQSARFAGLPRDDAANNRKLVAALAGVPDERRTARFCCAMAFAVAGRVLIETDGRVEGRIVDLPRGSNGFGYDPHFYFPPAHRTLAELSPEEKNSISHRSRALRAMLTRLRELFED